MVKPIFKRLLLVSAAAAAGLFACGCSGGDPVLKDPAIIQHDISYLGLSCVEVKRDPSSAFSLFQKMQKDGREKGYTPLMILRDDRVLDETMAFKQEDAGSLDKLAKEYLHIYGQINMDEYFAGKHDEYEAQNLFDFGWFDDFLLNPPDPDIDLEGMQNVTPQEVLSLGFTTSHVYIAKAPVQKASEALAYVPVGGFNDCPSTEIMMAAAEKWYTEYGAVPCAVGYDTLQFYVENPVTDPAEVAKLAEEMYLFCFDIVDQGVYTLDNLEKSIAGAHYWYFWWD